MANINSNTVKSMKSITQPYHRILITTLFVAGVALLGLSTPAQAQEKGATRQLRLSQIETVADVEAAQPGDLIIMSCPKCKDTKAVVVEKSFKGVQGDAKREITVHLCPGCKTVIKTAGQGKAKADKVTHVCEKCGNENVSCCLVKKGELNTPGMGNK
jgi:DNA-directed RNA polymerase subunit M/transcription elongation factor TFIIS